ncbi:MAG: hypothetical protein FH756_03600 [Firmicutes bacterium]|nr:hypothetical protein [Bacillota bacterium]
MSIDVNPYTLFLILILLVLSTDKNADAKLMFLKNFTEQTSHSLSAVREGVETMQASFQQAHTMFAGASNNPA